MNPPRERQGRFDLAPAPLTTKREGPCPSFLDYPPRSSDGAAMPRPYAVRRQTSVTRASRSKARLRVVTTRRRFMAKPCTPHLHCAARAVIQAVNCQCWGSRGSPLAFSWGFQRGRFSFEREPPPFAPSSAIGAATPPAQSTGYFSSIFLKK